MLLPEPKRLIRYSASFFVVENVRCSNVSLTLEAYFSTLLTTGPWKLNLTRVYFSPSGEHVSKQGLQHANYLLFFFAWSEWCYQGHFVLREVRLSFSDHIMTSRLVNKALEQNCNIVVHPLDFLYLRLPCLSISVIHLRTREMTPFGSMGPVDPP